MWPFDRNVDGYVTIAVPRRVKMLTFRRCFFTLTVEHDTTLSLHSDVWCFETMGVGKWTCASEASGEGTRALSVC